MDTPEIFSTLARLPFSSAKNLPQLTAEQLNDHPAGHPNSIAWLLWHSSREVDAQLAPLTGQAQLWDEYAERFDLGELGASVGYGHSSAEAARIKVNDQALLLEYLEATLTALGDYASTLTPTQLDEVIDRSWDPAVTRGVRLISIIDDAIAHVAQAAYAAGILTA
ncbi:DinB family protein [Glutamicibacter bergerei]|uniref:DinB family protein n=1 Tax=Glutamicibacter bergerei TaxID=256702 RepID=A0ABV9MIP3_9MICC|nr:aspartate/tyrosine/aromatic aminotransferase [Micrococcaceae bacterium]